MGGKGILSRDDESILKIPPTPLSKREGVKKSRLPGEREYLQGFTNAVVWKVRVTRLCK
jgi:hypothetical protein